MSCPIVAGAVALNVVSHTPMRYLVVLFIVLSCACSRGEEPAASEQTAAPSQAAAASKVPESPPAQPAVADPPEAALSRDTPQTVELIDVGKPPFTELRAALAPGSTHKLSLTSEWVVTAGYGPAISAKSVMPSFLYELEAKVNHTVQGMTQLDLRVAKVTVTSLEGVNPGYAQLANQAADTVMAVTGTASVNAQGMIHSLSIDAPTNATSLIHDMLDQIEEGWRLAILPLPKEPVGAGAKWSATHVAEQRGALSEKTSSFELTGFKGSKADVKFSQQATTPEQQIQLPGSPGNAKLTLNAMDFKGDGQGSWDLDQLVPRSASHATVTLFKMLSPTANPEPVLMQIDATLGVKRGR